MNPNYYLCEAELKLKDATCEDCVEEGIGDRLSDYVADKLVGGGKSIAKQYKGAMARGAKPKPKLSSKSSWGM
jgi:hypothetical protein